MTPGLGGIEGLPWEALAWLSTIHMYIFIESYMYILLLVRGIPFEEIHFAAQRFGGFDPEKLPPGW